MIKSFTTAQPTFYTLNLFELLNNPLLLDIEPITLTYFEDTTHTLTFSAQEIKRHFLNNYSNFALLYSTKSDVFPSHLDFSQKWKTFLAENQNRFNMLYRAEYTDYKPLENFTRFNDTTTEYQGTETNTDTKNGTITEKNNVGTPTTNATTYAVANDSNVEYETGKVSQELTETTNTTNYNNFTDTNTKTFSNRKDITKSAEHGAIGVKSSGEYRVNEEENQKLNLLGFICGEFVKMYCVIE